jgi:hypothetical protein
MSDGSKVETGPTPDTIGPDDERPSFVMRWRSCINPWVVAFIAGIVTVTFIRFRTRYVPDAPAAIGEVRIAGLERVAGLRIVGVVQSVEDATPLGTLAEKLRVADKPITVVALTRKPNLALPNGVVAVSLSEPDAATLDTNLRTLLRTTLPAGDPARHGLILIDAAGQCRGLYGTTEDGIDEIFHRSQHILRDELAKAKGDA